MVRSPVSRNAWNFVFSLNGLVLLLLLNSYKKTKRHFFPREIVSTPRVQEKLQMNRVLEISSGFSDRLTKLCGTVVSSAGITTVKFPTWDTVLLAFWARLLESGLHLTNV